MERAVPILLLIYNRPKHTRQVLDALQGLGVRSVFVWADGPKNAADKEMCEQARQTCLDSGLDIVLEINDHNLGCKESVLMGVSWFFAQVRHGIILEDDCVPTEGLLLLCKTLLERHRHDQRVYMISGNNPMGNWESGHSHHFARIGHVWGWATWRDRWADFHPELPDLDAFAANDGFQRLWGNTGLSERLEEQVRKALRGEVDTWDFQWTVHHAMKGRVAAIPSENLVRNIGLDDSGTHRDGHPEWVSDFVSKGELALTEPPVFPEREYEASLDLARQMSAPALPSSFSVSRKIKTEHNKLRILQVNTSDQGGGAEAVMMHHHQTLLQQGHEAFILTREKHTHFSDVLEMKDNVLAQIQELKPDIVHVHNIHGTAISIEMLSQLSRKIPVLWTLHDAWLTTGSVRHPFETERWRLSFLDREEWDAELSRRKNALADSRIRFTAPSHWLRDRMRAVQGTAVHFVPNAQPATVAAKMKLQPRPYLLYVANHAERNPYKDLDTLLRGWRISAKKLCESCPDLLCIGGKERIETRGAATMRMTGRIANDEVLSLMQNAVAVVQSSLQDNAPLTITEAHAVGTPVIASLVGGIPEMLTTTESQLMFRTGDTAGVADAIAFSIEKNELLRNEVREMMASPSPGMSAIFLGHYLELMKERCGQ
jgi:glycosyltransferase involved in cell wall biosynthesis